MRNNMKQLKIGNTPVIRAYAQYLFLDSIINNEDTTGALIAEIDIPFENISEWSFFTNNADIKIESKTLKIYEEKYKFNTKKCAYRKIKNQGQVDDFICKINYQQYTNIWDNICIFVDNCKDNFLNSPKTKYSFGNHCANAYFVDHESEHYSFEKEYADKYFPLWMKLSINDDYITYYYSYNGLKWVEISRNKLLNKLDSSYYIGVVINLSDNQYYKWLFNNFIQIKLDYNNPTHLDYTCIPQRDWNLYTYHPFVKYSEEKLSILDKLNISLCDYLKVNIDNNKYIELYIDEYYLPKSNSYMNFHHRHQNLIYGYNGDLFDVLTVQNGKPLKINVKYSDIELGLCNSLDEICIRTIEYKPCIATYKLNISLIKEEMKNYLYGINSTIFRSNILAVEEGYFGIKVLYKLLDDAIGRELLFSDIRISYILMEHAKCMEQRIIYVFEKFNLKRDETEHIKNGFSEIVILCTTVMNYILKFKLTNSSKIPKKILSLLQKLIELETKYYSLVISILERMEKDV